MSGEGVGKWGAGKHPPAVEGALEDINCPSPFISGWSKVKHHPNITGDEFQIMMSDELEFHNNKVDL